MLKRLRTPFEGGTSATVWLFILKLSNSNSYCGDSDHAEEDPSTYGSAFPEKFSIRKRRGLCDNFFQRIEKGLSPEARQENAARPPTPCRPLRAPCPACETKHLPQGSARGSTNCSANVSPPNVGQMIATQLTVLACFNIACKRFTRVDNV